MTKRYSCEQVVPIEQEPRHHLVIENEFVRAFAVEIAPHDRTLCHRHPHDYLLYVVGDGDIVSAARDEEPKKLSYRDGECELLEAGMVHVVENLGETAFRNVVVELLPKAENLLRGPAPKHTYFPRKLHPVVRKALSMGLGFETVLDPHFNSQKIGLYVVDLYPYFQLEISGPAVIAIPYGGARASFRDSAGLIYNINKFNDLAFILAGKGSLCSYGRARAVIFQLGACGEQPTHVRVQHEPLKSLRAHADESE